MENVNLKNQQLNFEQEDRERIAALTFKLYNSTATDALSLFLEEQLLSAENSNISFFVQGELKKLEELA